ncbi:MAG: hypothetical protein HYU85_07955 [Chloroflexi bacterium]|nr:hypothetical protein [Chloroflexota bacterium]MBI3040650.1 hypothetical protein [Chloroflexota bacterium]MBI3930596.1 hypothetical protein [Chloroflexota bacterium]
MSSELEDKIVSSLVDERLPCLVAFDVAGEVKVGRRQVGDAANRLKIRVVDCQLGCFDSKKATHDDLVGKQISRAVIDTVESCLVGGSLPCAVAFKVAETLKVTPREVGDAATRQKIKISRCQLGCFP